MPDTPSRTRALAGLGGRLRAVREYAGLSGTRLAEAAGAGWTQSKVSKIETGRQLPTVADVTDWAQVTGTDPEPLLALRIKAVAEYTAYKDVIADAGGAVAVQDDLSALASSSTFLATYHPLVIPGRLQTPAYMRGMCDGDEYLADDGIPADQVGHMIAARLRRQAIMYEPGREIVHIVGEAALRTRIGGMTTATLRAQLAHLAEMSELPGHTFGVVPFTATMPFTPLSGWSMYDRDLVDIETLDGVTQLTEPAVVARYSRWLEQLLDVALVGPDAAEFCRRLAAELGDAR